MNGLRILGLHSCRSWRLNRKCFHFSDDNASFVHVFDANFNVGLYLMSSLGTDGSNCTTMLLCRVLGSFVIHRFNGITDELLVTLPSAVFPVLIGWL